MSRILYEIYNLGEAELDTYLLGILKSIRKKKIVSWYKQGYNIIVARYGVNKKTLQAILRKELKRHG
jgi:hypothetical protein